MAPHSLNELTAFLIKTVIDNIANGGVEMCKKQAAKIFQLTSFNKEHPVEISLQRTFNLSTAVLYINKLHGIPESKILNLLKPQGDREVKQN